jgi:hypothetical protein
MFSSVDFPQPEGPTIQTNSPSLTDKLIFSRTGIEPPPATRGLL